MTSATGTPVAKPTIDAVILAILSIGTVALWILLALRYVGVNV